MPAPQAATLYSIIVMMSRFGCWNTVRGYGTCGQYGLIMGRFLKFGVTDDFALAESSSWPMLDFAFAPSARLG
jgi:hypothetical protein